MNKFVSIIIIIFTVFLNNVNAQGVIKEIKNDTLVVGIKSAPPFVIEKSNGEYEGISVFLWKEIAKDLGLKYKFKKLTLNKILSSLQSGELDLCINPLTVTSERVKKIDFSQPYYVSSTAIAIKGNDSSASSLLSSFFSMTMLKALLTLFGILLVFGFIVWLLEKNKSDSDFEKGFKGIWSGIWWSAATMTTVGYGDKTPKTFFGRIIGLVWMFTSIIIISSITANITSSLTLEKLGAINDVNALRKYRVGCLEKSSTADYLHDNLFKIKTYKSLDNALKALDSGEVENVAHDEPILKYKIQKDSLVGIKMAPIKMNKQFYAFGFPKNKNDSLKNIISDKIIQKMESSKWKLTLSFFDLLEL